MARFVPEFDIDDAVDDFELVLYGALPAGYVALHVSPRLHPSPDGAAAADEEWLAGAKFS